MILPIDLKIPNPTKSMEFCEKCGGIIIINENGTAVCAACNHRLKKKPKLQASEKIANKEVITIINEKEETTDPVVEIKCPKCGYVQLFSSPQPF